MKILNLKGVDGQEIVIPYHNIAYLEVYKVKTDFPEYRLKIHLINGEVIRIADEEYALKVLNDFLPLGYKIKMKIRGKTWDLLSELQNLKKILKKK
uniref:Uncharacterized protein n=1 Tax=candidate division WOR-3 bacterium TaxID=2052148 RepID=A0A7V3ZSX5_UNCW3